MVGVIAITSTQSVEGSPSPGTCLPLDKGGTGCEVLPVASGGTGADSADGARTNILQDYATSGVEQDTGTKWIDGKIIYRKVYTGTLGASAAESFINLQLDIIPGVEVIDTGGWWSMNPGDTSERYALNSTYSASTYSANATSDFTYYRSTGVIRVRITVEGARPANRPYMFWIEYTRN